VGAHPNYDFLTIVAGIRPAKPGFASITIEPRLGTLREVHAGLIVPQGMVEADYKRDTDGVKAQIKLPDGVGGKLVWKGRSIALHSGEQRVTLP
jgi:hypothetical protein